MILSIDVSVKKSFVLVWLLLLIIPTLTSAHNTGNSYEEEKDGFLIDIGYTPEILTAGDRARFDFALYSLTATTSSKDLFTDLWVQIIKNDKLHFSSNLNQPDFGPAALNLLLIEPGEYEIYVRFQQESTRVTETTFNIQVAPMEIDPIADQSTPWVFYALWTSLLLLFNFFVWLFYSKWRQ